MRWLDLTVQQVNATGQLSIVPGCSFRLMGRDGVPLPTTPRLVQSKGLNGQTVSNLIINTGNRVDVLVKCDAPGTYLLVSGGAGPFKTNPAACKTTHCELFGDTPVTGATVLPGNNLYNGFELSGAVMAVLNVAPLPADGSLAAEPNFADGVCRSMLEKWYYTDFLNFPPGATKQCFSFMNANFGGMCAVNNQPLLVTPVEQGTSQEWEVRDTTYHPFHLHMAPVRMAKLPRCATDVTNIGCPTPAPPLPHPCPTPAPLGASTGHAIPHEDEGCLAVLEMTCPGSKPKTASCPNTY
ncbi:hypothetical protein HYH03_004909 [Edaphochlamys debaryana]|uniref:Plastocyanin-like domain-containing protein n=1 Tax=Edaphochlamys debaryana TaxID=47281 RepID=A0A836C2N6_9CHLO|nr:hypothetical protein HYH03_004909 [Edaphochlamys debaryana]|eukprot:KAG2496903.1 hypothetical protein HYH03_004909 [Edaphochlamys debaryana]